MFDGDGAKGQTEEKKKCFTYLPVSHLVDTGSLCTHTSCFAGISTRKGRGHVGQQKMGSHPGTCHWDPSSLAFELPHTIPLPQSTNILPPLPPSLVWHQLGTQLLMVCIGGSNVPGSSAPLLLWVARCSLVKPQ